MAGPFDSILNMLGIGGGPAAPVPANQQAEAQPSMVPAVSPPRFAGERTGIMGAFDNLSGAPTRSEWQAGQDQQKLQMEAEQNKVLAELAPEINRIREANPGAQPHDIMRQIIASPTFTKAALRVPAPAMTKFMGELTKATQAPSPEAFQQGNSYGTRDPVTGKVTIQGQVPTTEMLNRQHMLGLSEDDRLVLAGLTGKTNSDKEQALNRLIAAGKVTRDQADRIIAGQLVVQPIRDQFNTVTGHAVVDLLAGHTQMLPPPQAERTRDASAKAGDPSETTAAQLQAQQAPNAPAQQRQAPPPPESRESDLIGAKPDNDFQNPADVYDVASPLGTASGMVSSLTGNFPGQETSAGPRINKARARIATIRAAAQTIRDGRTLKSESEHIDRIMPNPDAFFQNPLDEVNKAIARRELITGWWDQDLKTSADPTVASTKRAEASGRIGNYRRMLSAEAPLAALQEKRAQLMQGKGGVSATEALSVIPGAQSVTSTIGAASDAINKRGEAEAAAANPYLKLDQAQLEAEGEKPNLTPTQKRNLLAAVQALKAKQGVKPEQPVQRAPTPSMFPPQLPTVP